MDWADIILVGALVFIGLCVLYVAVSVATTAFYRSRDEYYKQFERDEDEEG